MAFTKGPWYRIRELARGLCRKTMALAISDEVQRIVYEKNNRAFALVAKGGYLVKQLCDDE